MNEEEKNDILFLFSTLDPLHKFLTILKSEKKELLTLDLKRKIINILTNLIFFVV